MQQFQVPQFIETESKIVGPLTLKQFLYVAVAALISFFSFFLMKTFAWLAVTVFVGTIAISLAFVKYNGRPLTVILKSVLAFAWHPKLYLWQKEQPSFAGPKVPEIRLAQPAGTETPVSKIKSLWTSLITKKPPIQPKV